MAIEIVDFPIKNGDIFQFAMLNYQRVTYITPLNKKKQVPRSEAPRHSSTRFGLTAAQADNKEVQVTW